MFLEEVTEDPNSYLIQFVLAMRSMETWRLPYNNTITDFVYEKRSPRLCCCTSISVIILQQNIKTTDKHDDTVASAAAPIHILRMYYYRLNDIRTADYEN